MEIIETSSKTAVVQISIKDLNTFTNAINEACNGIYEAEFKTRMGGSREEAMALADAIMQVVEKLRLSDNPENS